MKNMRTSIILNFTLIALFSFSATIGFAQKGKKDIIEKDPMIIEAMKHNNTQKGFVSYNVMKNIAQFSEAQQVKFKVEVEEIQNVIVEVFNDEGKMVSVLYNDLLNADNPLSVVVDDINWTKNKSYYIRVTTDDFIENHEIVFSSFD